MENWMIINNATNYEISDKGRVKRICSRVHDKFMSISKDKDGYEVVGIVDDTGKKRLLKIHRLVAIHFIPNPENKPQVNHLDAIRDNNDVSNLEWTTAKENVQHGVMLGNYKGNGLRGENTSNAKLTDVQAMDIINAYNIGIWTHEELAIAYNVSHGSIDALLSGKTWKHCQT